MAATRLSTRYHPPRLAWQAAGLPLQTRPQFAGLSRNELATRTGLHDHPSGRADVQVKFTIVSECWRLGRQTRRVMNLKSRRAV
jgi:hypothetical protein